LLPLFAFALLAEPVLAEPVRTDKLPPAALARLGSFQNRYVAGLRYAAFVHDGKAILVCSSDGLVRLWDAQTGDVKKEWKMPSGAAMAGMGSGYFPSSFALSPDGKRLAAADGRGMLQTVEIESGQTVWSSFTQRYSDLVIQWKADGKQVVAADRQGVAHIHD